MLTDRPTWASYRGAFAPKNYSTSVLKDSNFSKELIWKRKMYWTNPGTIRTLIEGNISTKCNCFLYNKLFIMTESFIQGYGSVIDSVPYSKHHINWLQYDISITHFN